MRMQKILMLTGALLALAVQAAWAADAARGKQLHDQYCIDCHSGMVGGDGTLLYKRKDRRVKSYEALLKQINRCDQSLGLKWFPEDVADVAAYLNREFYKFPAK